MNNKKKKLATWECAVTVVDGDLVSCDARMLGQEEVLELWEVEVPRNRWVEGDIFYVVCDVK